MKKHCSLILFSAVVILSLLCVSGCVSNGAGAGNGSDLLGETTDHITTGGESTEADKEGEEISADSGTDAPEVTDAGTEKPSEPPSGTSVTTEKRETVWLSMETITGGVASDPIPDVTTVPEATTVPEITTEPEATTEPESTTKPEVTSAPEPEPSPEPSDFVSTDEELWVTMKEVFKVESYYNADKVHCRVMQGACTDGTYYYVALNDGNSSSASSLSAIRKYNLLTGELVATYADRQVAHCNDMTYNPETDEIIAVHNSPERQVISILDADTFTLKEKKTLTLEIYSMAYDPYEECYWVGLSNCYNFAKLDFDFQQVGDIYEGYESGYIKQGMDLDSKYLYFSQYNKNSIIVYDKEGTFVKEILLPMQAYETENICHIGDTFYIGYYTTKKGGMVYELELRTVTEGSASVEMTEYESLPQYTDADGALCKVAQGSCTDGTYLYLAMNNDDKTAPVTAIRKIDLSTGEVVLTKEGFSMGNTNDMTYNSKTNQIIAVHNTPEPKVISIIDADTLEVVETKTLGYSIYSIAYDSTLDCYWVGLSSCYNFARYDTNFKTLELVYTGYNSGYTKQGMDCDGEYLYFLLSAKHSIAVYKTDGTFVALVKLPVTGNSAQSICHIGDTFYIGYNVSSSGGILYTATVTVEEE